VPDVFPAAMPVEEPIEAIVLLLLVHVPPLVADVYVVVYVRQRLALPEIAAGSGFTVTTVVAIGHAVPVTV
jgi:hypothetical protein